MIPKIIHYCWFGGNEMSDLGKKCIESWKKFCPDYEIKRWDETNYDISKNEYMRQAYENKKWAFVSDYARLDIIHEYGGIYLDTDVELIKSIDDLLGNNVFMGIGCTGGVNTGLGFGAEAEMPVIRDMLECYDGLSFVNNDGSLNTTPCVKYQTDFLKEHGFVDEDKLQTITYGNADNIYIYIYPMEYFCPMHYKTGKLSITDKTYSIHHYESTHWDKRLRDGNLRMRRAYKEYGKFGFYLYSHFRIIRLLDMIKYRELRKHISHKD